MKLILISPSLTILPKKKQTETQNPSQQSTYKHRRSIRSVVEN
jgi:hypothetical protein